MMSADSVKKLTIKAAKGTFRWVSGNSKSSAYNILSARLGRSACGGTAFDFDAGPDGNEQRSSLLNGSARFCGAGGCKRTEAPLRLRRCQAQRPNYRYPPRRPEHLRDVGQYRRHSPSCRAIRSSQEDWEEPAAGRLVFRWQQRSPRITARFQRRGLPAPPRKVRELLIRLLLRVLGPLIRLPQPPATRSAAPDSPRAAGHAKDA